MDLASESFAAYGRNLSLIRFFSPSGRSWVAYRELGPCVVVLGGPAGDLTELPSLRRAFCRRMRRRIVLWYGSGVPAAGGRSVRLGGEGIVRPALFTLRGRAMSRLRSSVHGAARDGVEVEETRWAEMAPGVRADVAAVESEWRHRHRIPLGFSVSRFEDAVADARPWLLARRRGRVEAFVTLLLSADGRGWVLDLMRRRPGAAAGAMDLLLLHAIERARKRGLEWLSLGIGRPASLRSYKDKFKPDWQDRYLLLPRGPLPQTLGLLAVAAVHVWPRGSGARGIGTARPPARSRHAPPRPVRRALAAAVVALTAFSFGYPALHRSGDLVRDAHTVAYRVGSLPSHGIHTPRVQLPRHL